MKYFSVLPVIVFSLFSCTQLLAQYKLKVDGNAQVVGSLELENSTTGGSIFIGKNAGNADNGEAHFNLFIGNQAGLTNATGQQNIFLGYGSGLSNTDGSFNTFVGSTAGTSNQSGAQNLFSGYSSGLSNLTGSYNTFLGVNSGALNSTGNYNTAVGYASNGTGLAYENSTALGYNAHPDSSNSIRIGNGSILSISGHVAFTSDSDQRFKKNVNDQSVPGLAFIQKLRPVTYNWDMDAYENWETAHHGPVLQDFRKEKRTIEKITFTGFLAQEVEAAAEETGYDFSGIDKPSREDGLYGLRYATFVVPLVKAVQEQQEQIANQKQQLEEQDKKLDELSSELEQVKALLAQLIDNRNLSESGTTRQLKAPPILFQNIPNPVHHSTRVEVYFPEEVEGDVRVLLSNQNGQVLLTNRISGNGKQVVEFDLQSFPRGIYQYSLVVNGQTLACKQLVVQ